MQKDTRVLAKNEPTAWQIIHQTPFVVVEKDRLTVKYAGPGNQHQDAGSVRANYSFAAEKLVDYFEVLIVNDGKTIAVGICSDKFVTTKLPGTDVNTFGYHADGKKFMYGKQGKAYGPAFAKGDVIGCGIHYFKKEVFFTRNGKYLGPAFNGISSRKWFPCVGLNTPGEIVKANFGNASTSIAATSSSDMDSVAASAASPFLFDVQVFMDEEIGKLKATIFEHPPPSVNNINSILTSYFLHAGYGDTLAAFEKSIQATQKSHLPPKMHERKMLNHYIQIGNINEALVLFQQAFPEIYAKCKSNNTSSSQQQQKAPSKHTKVLVRFHCQSVIELLRNSNVQDALACVIQQLGPLYNIQQLDCDSEEYKLLTDTVALLAYENPNHSPLGYLFDVTQRDLLAQELNQLIVEYQGMSAASVLEKLLIQLHACKLTLHEESAGVDNVLSL